jgi:hypothetical protein
VATDRLTGIDGTHEPAPPPLLSDPLAGLVTGDNLPSPRTEDDFRFPRIEAPQLPDRLDYFDHDDFHDPQPVPQPQVQAPAPQAAPPSAVKPTRQWPNPAAMARRLRVTTQTLQRVRTQLRDPKPAGVRTGMSVVIVIVVVTVVILYFVISSLADTFGQLFG